MISVGDLCVKTAGRDANKLCVVIDIINKTYVLVDGNTRRKKCNVKHLEPLGKNLKIKAKVRTEEILKAFNQEKLKIEKKETKKIKKEKKAEKPKDLKKNIKKEK